MTLIKSLKDYRDGGSYPFHMPGHKRRLANDDLLRDIYEIDITEIPGFDDLHNASGIIRDAEERAAKCFGADETHFLVNGSTGGILAAICGSVTSSDSVIVASNCHRSVYNGVMLSGAGPYVITPETESYFEIFGGISAEDIERALEKTDSKRVAVVITSPTYEGITSDVRSIAKICHDNNATLIVDAAHGAHFGFSEGFPESAIRQGADVVITSVHKTLPAMTQTALIHISKDCPSKERIRKMLRVFMTSSPSYVLMSSIDSLTELLSDRGEELFAAYEERLDAFYIRAEDLKCLSVLCKDKLTADGSADHDRSKIVVRDMTEVYNGKQLADILLEKYDICAEMATEDHVLLMTSIADTDEGFKKLINALCDIDSQLSDAKILPKTRGVIKRLFDRVVGKGIAPIFQNVSGDFPGTDADRDIASFDNNIKDTLFEDNIEYVPVELSEGRIAADFVSVYPPGIPVMVPGRVITGEAADGILRAINNGLEVTGLKDKEIAVVWERSSTL